MVKVVSTRLHVFYHKIKLIKLSKKTLNFFFSLWKWHWSQRQNASCYSKSCPSSLQSIYMGCNMIICIKSMDGTMIFLFARIQKSFGRSKDYIASVYLPYPKNLYLSLQKKAYKLSWLQGKTNFYSPFQDFTWLNLIVAYPNIPIV